MRCRHDLFTAELPLGIVEEHYALLPSDARLSKRGSNEERKTENRVQSSEGLYRSSGQGSLRPVHRLSAGEIEAMGDSLYARSANA